MSLHRQDVQNRDRTPLRLLYHYKNKLLYVKRAAQAADFSGASKYLQTAPKYRSTRYWRMQQFGLEGEGGRAAAAEGGWDWTWAGDSDRD